MKTNKKATVTEFTSFLPMIVTLLLFALCFGAILGFLKSFTFALVWGDVESHTIILMSRLVSSSSCFAYEQISQSRDISEVYNPYLFKRVKVGIIDLNKVTKGRIDNCISYGIEDTSGADLAKVSAQLGYVVNLVDLETGQRLFFEQKKNCYGMDKCNVHTTSSPVLVKHPDGHIGFGKLYLTLTYLLVTDQIVSEAIL